MNADFQSGYALDPDGVAANVRRCVDAGVAGLSIEFLRAAREIADEGSFVGFDGAAPFAELNSMLAVSRTGMAARLLEDRAREPR